MRSTRWRNGLLIGLPASAGIVGWAMLDLLNGVAIAAGIGLGLSLAVILHDRVL